MNKFKQVFLPILVVLTVFNACEKDEIHDPVNASEFQYDVNSKINYSAINIKSKGFKSLNGSDQVLVFKDMESFKSILHELERETKELDSAFVCYYSDLEEDALNDKEIEVRFSEAQPLFDFEHATGFNSLRKQIADKEEQWLKQEELDFENDPDNHFIVEEELRTLLNVDGEIQIGNLIYKLVENGYFEITGGNFQRLLEIDNNHLNMHDLPANVKFVGDMDLESRGSCRSGKSSSSYKTSGKKRIKWVVAHKTYPWSRYVIAKTKNYKKRKWVGWKKYRTFCKAQVYGYIAGTDENGINCSVKLNFNPNNSYAYETNKKKVKHKIYVATKTQSGWVKSDHTGAGGITCKHTLKW